MLPSFAGGFRNWKSLDASVNRFRTYARAEKRRGRRAEGGADIGGESVVVSSVIPRESRRETTGLVDPTSVARRYFPGENVLGGLSPLSIQTR